MSTTPPKSPSIIDTEGMQTSLDQNKDQLIAAILVVGFHHAFGPIVEFCLPPLPYHEKDQQTSLEKLELPEEWSFLPFLALPGKLYSTLDSHLIFCWSNSPYKNRWCSPKGRRFCILSFTTCTRLVCC